MDCYLNELSLQDHGLATSFEPLIKSFIESLNKLRDFDYDKINVPSDYLVRPIINGETFKQYIDNNTQYGIQNALITRFKSMRSNQFKKVDLAIIPNTYPTVLWRKVASPYLTSALIDNQPVVSFQTHADFIKPAFEVEIANSRTRISIDNFCHFSSESHFKANQLFIFKIIREQIVPDSAWNQMKDPFRLIKFMIKYLETENFKSIQSGNDSPYRRGKYKEIGTNIASWNGWEIDTKLSKTNHRDVFNPIGLKKYFLSLDDFHGHFEFFNSAGVWQKVIEFNGDVKSEKNTAAIKREKKNTHTLTIN